MRKDYILETETWLPAPLEEVFDFFRKAENLQQLTPPWLDFQILTPLPVEMKPGALIDYRLKLYGVPLRWKTEISLWEPPFRFVDSQRQGPYRKWVHTHTFQAVNGGTQMHDRVEYRLAGGVLAPLAHRLFVKRNVEAIFHYREARISEIFRRPR